MARIYDIKLSCGCLISLDKSGGLIPCGKNHPECKFEEEFNQNPKYKDGAHND